MARQLATPPVAGFPHLVQTARYIAPFILFLLFLGIAPSSGDHWTYIEPLRFVILAGACIVCWPLELSVRCVSPVASAALGIGVFLFWVAPETIFPTYRYSPLFSNSLLGTVKITSSTQALHNSWWFLTLRMLRASVVVPVVEELFWRGWLMRWLIQPRFEAVPLGTYTATSFWLTAILFASEHGPYWDVGLAAGIVFNWWMVRNRSIADCVLMHAVANASLSAYVIYAKQWQYWQ